MLNILTKLIYTIIWFFIIFEAFEENDMNEIIMVGFMGTWALMIVNSPED
jgi:hypothetical protein